MMKTRAVGLGTQADELDAQELVAAERQSDRATNEPLRTPGAGCPGKGCHTIFLEPSCSVCLVRHARTFSSICLQT